MRVEITTYDGTVIYRADDNTVDGRNELRAFAKLLDENLEDETAAYAIWREIGSAWEEE